MTYRADSTKVKFAVCVCLWSLLGCFYLRPLLVNNHDALNLIVTVLSILSGFLIAVITLIGDPKSLPPGGWQIARLASGRTKNRLVNQKWLFILYLLTLLAIFVSLIFKEESSIARSAISYTYSFLIIASTIFSFRLPGTLITLQQERIEYEIDQRRKNEGIGKNQ